MALPETKTDSLTPSTMLHTHRGSASMNLGGHTVVAAWGSSVILHLVALSAMLSIVFPYSPAAERDPPVARVEIVGNPDARPVPTSLAAFSNMPSYPVQDAPVLPRLAPSDVLDGSSGADSTIAAIGAGGGDLPGLATTSGLSIIGIGAGGGSSAESHFGIGGSGGGGAGTEFFGIGRSARGVRSVVYVVDRSGSMIDTFQHVRSELTRSISALRRSQKFHVIFFNAGDPLENPPNKLVSAIEAQKKAFFEFLSAISPEGSTHPERAMRRALALEPDLVYFLTDGEFDRGLVPKLDEWNRDRRVKIYTIAFFDSGGAALLEQIAREHGGEYKFVSENDLP